MRKRIYDDYAENMQSGGAFGYGKCSIRAPFSALASAQRISEHQHDHEHQRQGALRRRPTSQRSR